MDNSIYEVSRDEYAGVIAQINPKYSDVETYYEDSKTIIEITSKTGIHYTTRIIPEDGEEMYYVFNLPRGEECLPPKAVRKITLETRDEVQAFFDILNKIQKEKKMTEIFSNVSDEVRKIAETAWDIAVSQPNPVDVANFLNNATNYYKNTFTEEEIEFLQFYFYTRMEMMK